MKILCRQAFFLVPFSVVGSAVPLLAQETPADISKNPTQGGNVLTAVGKTPYEFWLTVMIALFGLSVIAALMFALRRAPGTRPEDISRPIIVVTVISGTLMLVTVGYSNEQIAPAFGLFGTIVGYMLSRFSQSSTTAPEQQSSKDVVEKT
jgi:hypothetical protein